MDAKRSKWTILKERKDAAHAEYIRLRDYMEGLADTGYHGNACECGRIFMTEADFARHFEVRHIDELNNNLNLGWCPVLDKNRSRV